MFAGKHGFITLRDLFRWADRYRLEEQSQESQDWLQHLADDGEGGALSLRLPVILVLYSNINHAVRVIRVHASGGACEEAGGRGHHNGHPGEAL